jgi:sulfate/thiosulfate transport system substrate-binding protein
MRLGFRRIFTLITLILGISLPAATCSADQTILNVSYDPTRRFYAAVNREFTQQWQAEKNSKISVYQSHSGSGAQARAVSFGLEADVVTLALAYDIDSIVQRAGIIRKDWQTRLPNNSAPYTSTVVFLVRKGNPKQIRDWPDLIRSDVSIITPNPKTSGGARWNYLAAYGFALRVSKNDEGKAREFLAGLYRNAPVLDTGARGATITFTRRGIGDVLIAWESDALFAATDIYPGEFDVVVPSVSILAEPPVAIVDKVVDRRGTREVADAYLRFLYTPAGQDLAARFFYRPRSQDILTKYKGRFADLDLLTIDQFGGWTEVQKAHFSDGAVFDQIYRPGG